MKPWIFRRWLSTTPAGQVLTLYENGDGFRRRISTLLPLLSVMSFGSAMLMRGRWRSSSYQYEFDDDDEEEEWGGDFEAPQTQTISTAIGLGISTMWLILMASYNVSCVRRFADANRELESRGRIRVMWHVY